MRGETNIATDGGARYLADLTDEVSVSPADREGRYTVRMSYASRVHRPWYVSSRVFRDELVKKNEEKMRSAASASSTTSPLTCNPLAGPGAESSRPLTLFPISADTGT